MAKKALPKVVTDKEFRKAVEKLRVEEKKNTRARDKVSAMRRKLPMVPMDTEYVFKSAKGEKSFLELFENRDQLIVYHFMWHPKDDTFCNGCSMVGDQIPDLTHINNRNTNFVMISDAPLKSIERHKKRMGWDMPWYSGYKTGFNQALGIDGDKEHALSVFLKDGKKIYRTYFTGGRGVEYMGTPFSLLDLTPYGRQEKWETSPKGWPQTDMYFWWKMHDDYKEKSRL